MLCKVVFSGASHPFSEQFHQYLVVIFLHVQLMKKEEQHIYQLLSPSKVRITVKTKKR